MYVVVRGDLYEVFILLAGLAAIDQIFRVIDEQSQASFDADWNFISYYNWTGLPGSLAGSVNNGGNGEPKGYTGMVGTHHRPSDDLSTFGELSFRAPFPL
jgi:meiotically up-regulated gene 157 (Mug157) protein